jgi:energy-coupling factor transport system permease protein
VKPRAAAVWAAAAVAMVVLTTNPVYRALIALVALNLLLARRRPGVKVGPLLVILFAFALLTMAYNPLISHAGTHRLTMIPPDIPGIGGPVTLESLAFGVSAAVGLVSAALAVSPVVLVLEPTDLLEVLPGALHGTGTALAASLNLVPAVARSFSRVREAELLRGSPNRGIRGLAALLVPVTLTTVESSVNLAEAMEARAYGSGPRTRLTSAPPGAAEVLAISVPIVAFALLLALRITGAVRDWYPFPSLSAPEIHPLAVLACLLLTLPLMLTRGR